MLTKGFLANMLSKRTKIFLLARPWGFGKTLTISTLKSVFSEDRKLFKGLDIEPRLGERRFAPRPVLMLDMSAGSSVRGAREYAATLCETTLGVARRLGLVVPPDNSPSTILGDLIVRYHHKTGQKMAVLIDEYDSPLLDFMSRPDEMETVRLILRDCYRRLKVFDELISFIFITGITKSASGGIFSDFNSYTYISALPDFGRICGFTHDELEGCFGDTSESPPSAPAWTGRSCLRSCGGSTTDSASTGEPTFNPFSILKFLNSGDFRFANYWFGDGGSNRFAQYIQDKRLTVGRFRGMPISWQNVHDPGDHATTTPEGFLFQTGYLSLRPGNPPDSYTLDYPNLDVYGAMSRLLTVRCLGKSAADQVFAELQAAVRSGDVGALIGCFNRLLAKMPQDYFDSERRSEINFGHPERGSAERLYGGFLLSLLVGAFCDAGTDTPSRPDGSLLVVETAEAVWAIGLKAFRKEDDDGPAKADEAFAQILAKRRAERYDGRRVLLGIAIDDNLRAITAWKYQVGRSEPQTRAAADAPPEPEPAPKPKRGRKPKP